MRREAIITRDEGETEAFGERLAASLSSHDVVYLIGDLGSGKTCLARGLARGRGASVREVASPTFAIVHEYAGSEGAIVLRHLDLYRLNDSARDLEVLGLPESVAGAPVVIEWPSRAIRGVLPPTVEVTIEARADGSRAVDVSRVAG